MRRRTFMLHPPHQVVDYRDDELLLGALELEIKLANRFFNIVDFINDNLVDKEGKIRKEDLEYKNKMAERGIVHWEKAKKIIATRQNMDIEFGSLDNPSETNDVAPRNSRKDS